MPKHLLESSEFGATELLEQLRQLRARLEPAFAPDTAFRGTAAEVPSAGHCAVVAAIVQRSLGGEMLSTGTGVDEHWFNRVDTTTAIVDVDLTGDQFGHPAIRVGPVGSLYADAIHRDFTQLEPEALDRAYRLACRAGLVAVANQFEITQRDFQH